MKIRFCLRCDGPFVSWGNGNHLCKDCNKRNRHEARARASVPLDVMLEVSLQTDLQAFLDENV